MPEGFGQRFIQALHKLEESGDAKDVVQLFAPDAKVDNTAAAEEQGAQGVEQFWRRYRETFKDIHSEFRSVIEQGNHVALEWTSTGSLSGGHQFKYDGVSILETDGERIKRFHGYFDPSALAEPLARKPAA